MKRFLTLAALSMLSLALPPAAKADYHDTYRVWREVQDARDWSKMDEFRGWLMRQQRREWPSYFEATRMAYSYRPATYRPGVILTPAPVATGVPDREVYLRAYDASRVPRLPYRLRGDVAPMIGGSRSPGPTR